MEYKKINVLIVTYKQADVIGRNLDSILQQKEYGLNEIVICDDNSPDNNWEIISQYKAKYPDIIRAYRNESNLGIYGNSNKLVSLRGESDLYCWIEGDDALCDGFFKAAQDFISSNRVDVTGATAIFSGYKTITPTGNVILNKNDYLKRHPKRNPFGAYSRHYVSWRSGLFSSEVLNRFEPVDVSKGLSLAESLFDSQWFLHSDSIYYLPGINSIYYSGIGVSTFIFDDEYEKNDAIIQHQYYLKHQANSFFDKMWGKSKLIRATYLATAPSNLIKKIWSLTIFSFCFLIGMLPYGIDWRYFYVKAATMAKSK